MMLPSIAALIEILDNAHDFRDILQGVRLNIVISWARA
jgi:hypothetical protein